MHPDVVCVGLTTLDSLYTVETHPGPDDKLTALAQELAAGGPAANAAVTSAALGSRTTLVTALGTHPLARCAADDLEMHGVRIVDAAADRTGPPAVSSVYVQPRTAQRSVVSVNAASLDVAAPPGLEALVADCRALLVDGHHPRLATAAVDAARRSGVVTLLDGGSWKPGLDRVLDRIGWAVCGERFRAPGTSAGPAGEEETVAALLGRGVEVVAFTHGPGPVTWWTGGDRGAVDVPVVEARDTLGAGDAFHGALLHRLAQEPAPRSAAAVAEALRAAAAVAAVRVSVPGPRAWLAHLKGFPPNRPPGSAPSRPSGSPP